MPSYFYGITMWNSRAQLVSSTVQKYWSTAQGLCITQCTVDKPTSFPRIHAQFLYSVIHSFFTHFISVSRLFSHSIHRTYNYIQQQEKNFQVIRKAES